MAIYGADLAQGQQLAQQFTSGGGDLQAAISKIDSAVSQSTQFWTGPNADKFRSEWSDFKSKAQPMINSVQHEAPAAVKASMNAIAQATGAA